MIGRPSKPPLVNSAHDEDGDDETSHGIDGKHYFDGLINKHKDTLDPEGGIVPS